MAFPLAGIDDIIAVMEADTGSMSDTEVLRFLGGKRAEGDFEPLGTDQLIGAHREASGKIAYEAVPHLVQHYGAFSSLPRGRRASAWEHIYKSLKLSNLFIDDVAYS